MGHARPRSRSSRCCAPCRRSLGCRFRSPRFRDSAPSAIFVIFITAIWPVIINTAVGIRNIPQDYRNVAPVLRLNHVEYFWRIMIPSAAPYIFTGLRIGIGLSWLAIVAAEMLTGGVGIGFFIWDAWNSSRLSDIVVALDLHRRRRLHPRSHRCAVGTSRPAARPRPEEIIMIAPVEPKSHT